MKKYYFFIFIVAFICSSCSNELEEKSNLAENDSKELILLKENLSNFNKDYSLLNFDNGLRYNRAKKYSWFKRVLLTAVADVGAYLADGKVSDAVTASTLTWNILKERNAEIEKANKDVEADKQASACVFKDSPSVYLEKRETIGDIHNFLSVKLIQEFGDTISEVPSEKLIKSIYKDIKDFNLAVNEDIDIQNSIKNIDKILNAFNPDLSVSENFNNLKNITTDRVTKEMFDVCSIVVEGLENIPDTDTTYIKKVNATIEDSNLSDEIKENLLKSVSIANSSALLWNTDALLKTRNNE
ncbi:hypothetical protein [Prevotella corporis]|uniref:hypothetical protein n=1 Tax=Prevotella corporis TaxID=28128 RepID=UPI0003FEF031|nr:hypothetical protein [Prevotella corporis]